MWSTGGWSSATGTSRRTATSTPRAVIGLADTACGYGSIMSLPEGGTGFTTIELKTNFLRTVMAGTITCEATLVHGGRTTQIWDATVRDPDGRAMALFRCTQLILS